MREVGKSGGTAYPYGAHGEAVPYMVFGRGKYLQSFILYVIFIVQPLQRIFMIAR